MNNIAVDPKITGRRRFLLTALCVFIGILDAAATSAQSEHDIFASESAKQDPGKKYDAHAACNSKTLPSAGYRNAGAVPGRNGKECYWVRSEEPITTVAKPDPAPALPGHLVGAETPSQALNLAQQFYQTRLDHIRQQRIAANQQFIATFLGCAAEVGCLHQSIRAAQQNENKLRADQILAIKRLVKDIGGIREHFGMPGEWPGNPVE